MEPRWAFEFTEEEIRVIVGVLGVKVVRDAFTIRLRGEAPAGNTFIPKPLMELDNPTGNNIPLGMTTLEILRTTDLDPYFRFKVKGSDVIHTAFHFDKFKEEVGTNVLIEGTTEYEQKMFKFDEIEAVFPEISEAEFKT